MIEQSRSKRKVNPHPKDWLEEGATVTHEQVRAAIQQVYENRTYEVFYDPAKRWIVKKVRKDAPPRYFSTKRDAVKFARNLCDKQGMSLMIRDKSGRLQQGNRMKFFLSSLNP